MARRLLLPSASAIRPVLAAALLGAGALVGCKGAPSRADGVAGAASAPGVLTSSSVAPEAQGGSARAPGAESAAVSAGPSGAEQRSRPAASAAAAAGERQPLVVFAAASLTDAFGELERSFEAEHPEADVMPSYGGSQVLALQIRQGAPADVFASADEAHMAELVASGYAGQTHTLAENDLVILVPHDNPAGIAELSQLPLASRLVLGSANVPVGAYTRQLLARAAARQAPDFEQRVLARVVSEESNVRLVRAKVELGEADAAIVYRSDASSARRARLIEIPAELNVRARYPIAALTHAPHPELARRWIEHVLSDAGRRVLAAHGFLVPA